MKVFGAFSLGVAVAQEKYTNMLEAVRQKHDNAAEILRREMATLHENHLIKMIWAYPGV